MNVEVNQDQPANFLRLSEIEFLTGCLGGSPLRCKKQLWNFVFAGSDIDSALSVSRPFPTAQSKLNNFAVSLFITTSQYPL
jgi:hypothetical protein